MDKIRYSSFKFKVWEDKFFKIEKQRLHLEDIKMTHKQETDLSDNDIRVEEQKINHFRAGFSHHFQGSGSGLSMRRTESYKH
jgi:hypothetical protein